MNIGSTHAKKISTNHNYHDQQKQHRKQAGKKTAKEIIHAMYINRELFKIRDMLILLSPAKTLDYSKDFDVKPTAPAFLSDSSKLIKELKTKEPKDIATLMGLSDNLATLNFDRYQSWKAAKSISSDSKPALFVFQGDVYQGLKAETFNKKDIAFAQKHLRILSGLYGELRPLDVIKPYRLEMGTSLKIGTKKNLYEFWGDKIVNELNIALKDLNSSTLVNLASTEYFKSVNKKKLNAEIITPVFKDFSNGKYKMVMVYAKKARGMMANYIIKNRIENTSTLFNTSKFTTIKFN